MTTTYYINPHIDTNNRCVCVSPPNLGWLQYKLNKKELDYVWKCIDSKQKDVSHMLAGNLFGSYKLEDKNNWFLDTVLTPLSLTYAKDFLDMAKPSRLPLREESKDYSTKNPKLINVRLILNDWWVNYQKQHDFNPVHSHSGVYSFVIWLKNPTEFNEQNKGENNNTPSKNAFSFFYNDLLGRQNTFNYELGKSWEGTMLFFPSGLPHSVYPFYNCDEDRISVSGNLFVDKKNL